MSDTLPSRKFIDGIEDKVAEILRAYAEGRLVELPPTDEMVERAYDAQPEDMRSGVPMLSERTLRLILEAALEVDDE